jgi:hypothetical protein
MHHLEIIAVMALAPLGAWVAMGEGMVLEWWAKFWSDNTTVTESYLDENGTEITVKETITPDFPYWLSKPLATCPRCMVSAWGIPAALLTFPDINLWLLPVYLLAAVGLQEAIHR